jgi:menaquinone-dependent protoporphyrinogen oxidase
VVERRLAMRILVTAASKHSATQGIAEAIGSELVVRGVEVAVMPVQDIGPMVGYDAVVLGSAVYMGKWMKPAKEFVARESARLAAIPVWLFSSGPIGKAASTPDPADRRQGDEIAKAIGARDHRLFAGKLDRKELSLLERAPVRMAKLPDGDFRPWDEIRAWAADIAEALQPASGS